MIACGFWVFVICLGFLFRHILIVFRLPGYFVFGILDCLVLGFGFWILWFCAFGFGGFCGFMVTLILVGFLVLSVWCLFCGFVTVMVSDLVVLFVFCEVSVGFVGFAILVWICFGGFDYVFRRCLF